jgi:hypothetical protein
MDSAGLGTSQLGAFFGVDLTTILGQVLSGVVSVVVDLTTLTTPPASASGRFSQARILLLLRYALILKIDMLN